MFNLWDQFLERIQFSESFERLVRQFHNEISTLFSVERLILILPVSLAVENWMTKNGKLDGILI